MKAAERWSEHTKKLPPLVVRNHVCIQNQIGLHPTKWDRTGVIVEVLQFDQYQVQVDGTGRITLHNRKFLRNYIPVQAHTPRRTINDDLPFLTTQQTLPHKETHSQKTVPQLEIDQATPLNPQLPTPKTPTPPQPHAHPITPLSSTPSNPAPSTPQRPHTPSTPTYPIHTNYPS
jgi:hypothetical protein